ncbi:MaoC-like dehydratase protein (plasmid) [Rhizobium gallicum]|uniref:MaoC-like dehydratase protein n=1 Tax=Rhizobium gallicum TaxID=56730 RepID=A0A1L5NPI3_9HYPH|nr:MaoC/PaaZ C-terminal domain-containing protein [Rhizobium gallicum]APO69807.1 MaoC-like dehydratase protein [Rhizobium gallicum]
MIYFDEITVGEKFTTSSRTVFDADIVAFAGLSGDFNRLHVDDVFAASTIHKRRIAHGMLTASIVTGLRSRLDDYAMIGFLETQRKFVSPVFPGDTVTVEYEVVEARRSNSRPTTGVVTLSVTVTKQTGEIVQHGRDTILIERDVRE